MVIRLRIYTVRDRSTTFCSGFPGPKRYKCSIPSERPAAQLRILLNACGRFQAGALLGTPKWSWLPHASPTSRALPFDDHARTPRPATATHAVAAIFVYVMHSVACSWCFSSWRTDVGVYVFYTVQAPILIAHTLARMRRLTLQLAAALRVRIAGLTHTDVRVTEE
jgi:apolipoprotein N-acyltransferase